MIPHILGLDNGSGYWYLFWSGFGADIPILVGVWAVARKHNCQAHGCWRVGRHPVPETGALVCRKHHPTGGYRG